MTARATVGKWLGVDDEKEDTSGTHRFSGAHGEREDGGAHDREQVPELHHRTRSTPHRIGLTHATIVPGINETWLSIYALDVANKKRSIEQPLHHVRAAHGTLLLPAVPSRQINQPRSSWV